MIENNFDKTDDYLKMLNTNYIEKFARNYLNKLQIYIDDDVYKAKTVNLPQLKSLTILKFEKMIKKENVMKEQKRLNNLNKLTTGTIRGTKRIKINFQENSRSESASSTKGKRNKHKNFTKMRYIILDAGNKMVDIHSMDDDFSIKELYDPYKTYLFEENEKLRKQALDKIVSNAISSSNTIKTNSITRRLIKDKTNSNKFSSNNQTHNNENYSLDGVKFSKDKDILEMYSSEFFKKRLILMNVKEPMTDKDDMNNFENFMKFFKEACEINNYITIDQKIDYFMHLKNNLILNKLKSERRNLIPHYTAHRRKGQLGETADFQSAIHDSFSKFNQTHLNPEIQTFYENRAEDRKNSLAPNNVDQYVPYCKRNTHKATITFNMHNKYIIDLKNKFKIPDEIAENYKIQIDLENYYTDLLEKIKLSKKQIIDSNKKITDFQTNSSFEKIKSLLAKKEISLEKVIVRECEITSERFLYMMGKKAFDFRNLQHINFSRNLLGDIGASYLLFLIHQYSTNLEYLDISYNKIGKHACEYISEILKDDKTELLSLNIAGNFIGDKNFSEICVGISKNSSLLKLNASANELGKISSVILGTILRYDKKLKYLDVSKNYFNDDIIKNLLKGLISNSNLESLILNENNLSNASLKNFETTLSVNSTMKEIFLERNLFSNSSSSKFLSIFYKNCNIELISLIGNKLEFEFADAMIQNEKKLPVKILNKADYLAQRMKNDENINFHEYF